MDVSNFFIDSRVTVVSEKEIELRWYVFRKHPMVTMSGSVRPGDVLPPYYYSKDGFHLVFEHGINQNQKRGFKTKEEAKVALLLYLLDLKEGG